MLISNLILFLKEQFTHEKSALQAYFATKLPQQIRHGMPLLIKI